MIRLLLLILPFFLCGFMPREKTTRKVAAPQPLAIVHLDTVIASGHEIEFHGYDKPLRSKWETVLARNNSTQGINQCEIRVRYFTLDDKKIHERCLWLPVSIPPGETRLLKFSSWDPQLTYYYYLSRPNRAQNVVPYKTTVRVTRLIFQQP